MAPFCVAELGPALGVSTDSARMLLGDGLELEHRLPRCWDRLLAGGVPAFRARRVAAATRDLSAAAAACVDAEVVVALPALGVKALDGVVEAAKWRFHLAGGPA